MANSSCSEFADAGYHCVPYYQCDTCSTIIVDGSSLFDPRSSCGTSKETLWQSAVTNTLPTVSRWETQASHCQQVQQADPRLLPTSQRWGAYRVYWATSSSCRVQPQRGNIWPARWDLYSRWKTQISFILWNTKHQRSGQHKGWGWFSKKSIRIQGLIIINIESRGWWGQFRWVASRLRCAKEGSGWRTQCKRKCSALC